MRLTAPKTAAVGQPIELSLRVDGAADAAGYEARLLFDTHAAHLTQVENRGNSAAKHGWDVEDLGPVELSDGWIFGSYSCLATNCAGGGAAAASGGAGGASALAKIVIRADLPGPLQVRLSDVEVVDPRGDYIVAGGSSQVVTIDVGGAKNEKPAAHAAPQAPTGREPNFTTPRHLRDATGDRRIDEADVAEAAASWIVAHAEGATCAHGTTPEVDANGDGCIDIADVQAFAGGAGPLPAGPFAARYAPLGARAIARAASGGTFIVNSNGDGADAAIGDGICATTAGLCTLRAAIQEADADTGPNTIDFAIPGSGVQTIQLASSLPSINDTTGGLLIDGYTQPGASVNTDALADNAQIMVQIRGTGPTTLDGPIVTSAGNTFRGLSFFNIRRSIFFDGNGASGNSVVGCFVGTDASGTFGHTTNNLYGSGIAIYSKSANNQIGTTALADRNVISGNAHHGIVTYNELSNNNVVYNNIIGLSPDGLRRLPNLEHGIDINAGSSYNVIGGTGAGMRNVISGNGVLGDPQGPAGVEVSHATTTTGNKIVGNYFGTDLSGATAASWTYNALWGVHIEDGVNHTLVSDNVVVNSKGAGIKIQDVGTTANQITDNRIGLTATGKAGGNGIPGVLVANSATDNVVGPGNTITNNPLGVWIRDPDTDGNTITQNSIYANSGLGIDLDPNNQVNLNDDGDLDAGANQQLNFPDIALATPTTASGTACAGCTVEIFVADSNGPGTAGGPGSGAYGEGKTFLASTTADSSGMFSAPISATAGQWITSTATDGAGNTSEFSENVQVVTSASAPAAPSLTAASAGARSVTLQWTTPSSNGSAISSYKIYRGSSSGSETLLATVGAQSTYLDVEVDVGKTYWYTVAAVNGVGTGPQSNERSATPTGTGLIVSDRFDRTVASGLGTPDVGGAWNVSSTSRTKVGGSEGVIYGWTGGNQNVSAWTNNVSQDMEVLALVRLNATNPVGGSYQARVMARAQSSDARNGYAARITHTPSGAANWLLTRTDNGGGTGSVSFANGTLASSGAAGSEWWIRLRAEGTTISVKFWQDGSPEPSVWTASVTDSYWSSGVPSFGVYASSGLSSPFPDTGFENFDAVDLNSTSTATAPSAPSLTSATGGNGSVSLAWAAPSSDGGAAITGYNVYRGTSSGGELLLTKLGAVTSYTDSTVTNGTTYWYTVTAVNAAGESGPSNEASATPQATASPPSAPSLNSATPGDGSVSLQWSPPSSDGSSAITGYNVYRGTSSGGESLFKQLGVVTSYTDSTVTNGTTYWYTVTAVNGAGEGPPSPERSATPQGSTSAPSAPSLTSATPGDATVSLQWTAPSSNGGSAITGYNVYRGTSSGGESLVKQLGDVTTYTDSSLTNGTTYWYTVTAVNAVGESAASDEKSATPQAASGGATAFVSDSFDRTISAGFGAADVGGAWSVSSTSRTKVQNGEGVIYGWTGGNQDVRAWIPATVADQEILALVRLSATNPVGANYAPRVVARAQSDPRNGYSARLVHTPAGAVQWGLSRIENGGGSGTLGLGSGTLVSSGGAGTQWWIRLRAEGTTISAKFWKDGTTEPSSWTRTATDSAFASGAVSLGVLASSGLSSPFPDTGFASFEADNLGAPSSASAPSAPSLTSAAPGDGSVSLQWSAPSSDGGSAITGYDVFRGTSSGGESLVKQLGVVTSYTDSSLTNGTTYWYEVKAVNSVGDGPASNELSATPQAAAASAPSAPSLTSATPGDGTVALAWSAPSSDGGSAITGYNVYRGTSSGGESLVKQLGVVTSYTDSSLTNGTTYWYTVTAVNAAGESAASNELSATPQASSGGGTAFVRDAFDRTVARGFGTADVGGAWSVSSTSRTKVQNGEAVIYGWTGGNQDVRAWIPDAVADQEILALVRLSSTNPVGADYAPRVVARAQSDPRNGYSARVVHTPAGAVRWGLSRIENGGGSGTLGLGSGTLVSSGGAGTKWWIRLRAQGTTISVKFWKGGTTEPSGWTRSATDSAFASGAASLGVLASSGLSSPFPDTGFASFEGDELATAASADDRTLLAAGDIGDCSAGAGTAATADVLKQFPGETIALLGDNAYQDGSASDYANCYDPTWGAFKSTTRPSPGNHEYQTANASGYFGYFGAAAGDPTTGYYSFDLGDWHLVSLNSNCSAIGGCDAGSAEETWLNDDLAAHPAQCTLAFWHHPLFTSGGVGETAAVQPLWDDLYAAGADLVLNGHAHMYERFAPQTPAGAVDTQTGIRELVVGTGGAADLAQYGTIAANSEVRNNTVYGVLELTLHANSYDWKFLPTAGESFSDSGSGACH